MFKIGSLAMMAMIFLLFGTQVNRPPQNPIKEPAKQPSAAAPQQPESHPDLTQDKYNAELVKQLGADDYGMKGYVFVLLKTGKVTIADKEKSAEVFAGHFANMSRLAKEGKLVLAGPFVEGESKRGLFILNVTSLEEAEELVKTDPAVAAGVFDYELTKLYCSAALMKISEIHETLQKTKIQ